MPSLHESESKSPPLAVDIDGTLIKGDLLFEGILRMAAVSPLRLLSLPFWLLKGRAALKRRVALEAPLPDSSYQLNRDVLEEIESARSEGRDVWLATAADSHAAKPLAARIGAAGLLASDGTLNLSGEAKAEALVRRFGAKGYDYIGDGRRDMPVWRQAREAVGIGLPPRLARRLREINGSARFLPGPGAVAPALVRAMRPHQWVKNLLVFAPLLAHHESSPLVYLSALGLFAALSICASGAYLINDLSDLECDRRHPTKRRRPLASGEISLPAAAAAGFLLGIAGIALGVGVSTEAGYLLLLYLGGSLTYSLLLKRKLFLDVTALAGLYALRVLIGSAVSAPLSHCFSPSPFFFFCRLQS